MSMNRFLFSACLPVMIFSLTVNITPVHAGFDWTPPEDTKEVMMPDVPVTPVDEQNLPPVEDRSQQDEKMPVFEQPIIKGQQSGEVKMRTKVFSSQKPSSDAAVQNANKQLELQEIKPVLKDAVKTPENKLQELPPADSSVIPLPSETHSALPVVEKVNIDNQNSTDKFSAPAAPVEKKIEPIKAIQKAKIPQPEVTQIPQEVYKGGSEVDSYAGTKKGKKAQVNVPKPQDNVAVPPVEQEVGSPKKNELLINPFPLEDQKNQSVRKGKEVVPAHAAVKANEKAAIVESAPASSYPVVEGFGSDMPLVMALGQIVPAQYAYSFGKGVNPGVIVSWEGGKPWDQVLQGVLQPLGIHMNIDGNKLSLSVMAMEEPVVIQRPKENAPATMSTYPDPDNTGKKLQGKKAKDQPLKNPAETSKDKIIPLSTEIQPVEQEKAPVEAKVDKGLKTKKDKKSSKENENKPEKTVEAKTEKSELTEISSEKQKKNSKQHPQLDDVLEISPENEGKPKQESAPAFPEFEMTEGKLVSPVTEASKGAEPVKVVKEKVKVDQTVPAEKVTKEEESSTVSLVPIMPQETNVIAAEPVIEEKKKAPVDLKKIKVWEAKKGKDLETLLKEWCDQIGVELVWSAKDKHMLAHNVVVSGTLESALKVTFAQAVKNAPQYEVVKGDAPQVIVK